MAFRYLIWGVLFGFCFPIGAWIIDLLIRDLPLGVEAWVHLHRSNPIHWIVDLAPIVLGWFAYQIGRKQAALINHAEQLEEQVACRTEELVKSQAETAAALAATEEHGRFLAQMSDEIRNPLDGVIGMTERLLDSGLSREQQEIAEHVSRSGRALLTLVNDVLDFSKMEAGKLELEEVPFDLRACLEEVSELMAHQAREKGLELSIRVDPKVPQRIVSDPARLRQILLNLADNAVKFTREGEVAIEAALQQRQGAEVVLVFSISDTGPGIPKDRLDQLFRPFTQVDRSASREYGAGLGLVICKQLAELMRGEIGVKSVFGSGSTFWFTIRGLAASSSGE